MSRRLLVLVDAHRALGRPLCPKDELTQAMIDEVYKEVTAPQQKSAFSLPFLKQPAIPSKEEIRARVAETTRAVLAGERPPPGRLPRAIDAAARVLASLASSQQDIEFCCVLFGDAGDARCVPDAVPLHLRPHELCEAWDGSGSVTVVPNLTTACGGAAGLLDFQTVVVLTVRGLSLGPLLDTTLGRPPTLFWLHCVLDPPESFKGIANLCSLNGGEACPIVTVSALRDSLQRALRSVQPGSPPSDTNKMSSQTTSQPCATNKVSFQPRTKAPQKKLGHEVLEAVLARDGGQLCKLSPEQRKIRIQELVAEEVRNRNLGVLGLAASFIDNILDAPREVEQRILLEWYLVLCRTLAFVGDVVSLARANRVCRIWRSSLKIGGSVITLKLWKWSIRFGEPVPEACRWKFWGWLRRRHQPLIPTTGCAEEYAEKLNHGRQDETLADARAVIAADVPRTFASFESETGGPSPLLPSKKDDQSCSLHERREALQRVLLAVAADCPSLGYCQGMHMLAAFVISVAEEAGLRGDALEAEAFAFLASLLEEQGIRSWLEPPLLGLRTHMRAFGDLLRDRLPQLAAHLSAEGADPELLAMPWLQTLFAGFTMPRATLCRIWECWFLDGSVKVFFRTSLALLKHSEKDIISAAQEDWYSDPADVLKAFPTNFLEASTLLPAAWSQKVTSSQLRRSIASAELSVLDADAKGFEGTTMVELDVEMIEASDGDGPKGHFENLIELE